MILKVHVCSIVLHLSNVISHPLLNLMFINVIHTHRIILCVKTNSIFLYVHLVSCVTLKKKKNAMREIFIQGQKVAELTFIPRLYDSQVQCFFFYAPAVSFSGFPETIPIPTPLGQVLIVYLEIFVSLRFRYGMLSSSYSSACGT